MKTVPLTMYEACLLHNRAHRFLKDVVSEHIEQFKLTRMEWLALATVATAGQTGMTMSRLAEILGIGLPQLKALIKNLEGLEYLTQIPATHDKRVRIVQATPKAVRMVGKIEQTLRPALSDWLADIPRDQLVTYMQTVRILAVDKSR